MRTKEEIVEYNILYYLQNREKILQRKKEFREKHYMRNPKPNKNNVHMDELLNVFVYDSNNKFVRAFKYNPYNKKEL